MRFYACAALIAVVATPIVARGQTRSASGAAAKRTCEINVPTGSRLGAVRRCRTKAERDAARAENKEVVERIQSRKAFGEQMIGLTGN